MKCLVFKLQPGDLYLQTPLLQEIGFDYKKSGFLNTQGYVK